MTLKQIAARNRCALDRISRIADKATCLKQLEVEHARHGQALHDYSNKAL